MKRRIGAHVSASGGLDKAVERAHAIGCNAVQVFSASPRVWKKPDLDSIDTKKFFAKQTELDIFPVITHGLYLINLASDNPAQIQKSVDSLIFELQFDALIKGGGVVVHLGSHQGRGWEASKEQLAKHISTILKQTPEESTFLIENSAGQNGKLNSDLSEIRWLFDQVKSPRLKWCFDTCHGHAAGFKLSPKSTLHLDEAGKNPERGVIEDELEKLDLWKTLACIHVNDSKDPYASGRDRHENLKDGMIPTADLEYFLNLKKIEHIRLITEVPGIEGNGPDEENIVRFKQLIGE